MDTRNSNGQFTPGHQPTNKGLKGVHYSPNTEFKPGHNPMNELYDGATRIRKDNSGRPFVWIRIRSGVWDRLHLQKWKQKNGPIPAGHVLACKTTDTLNTDLSNWRLITLAENLRRNRDRCIDNSEVHERECRNCRQKFLTSNFWKKLCDKCKPPKKEKLNAICVVCEKPFETTRPNQKYCGKKCRNAYHIQLQKEIRRAKSKQEKKTPPEKKTKEKQIKKCINCKKHFEPNHSAEKYCSGDCRKEANRIANVQYRIGKSSKKLKRSSTNDRRKETVNPEDMPVLNRVNNRNDRDKLKREKIVSPDHTQMQFKHYDKKLRITRYFRTQEKYNKFLSTIQNQEV